MKVTPSRYIGMTILNGIVVGARDLGSTVEFRVLIDGNVETHIIGKATTC